jgi:hypothetical protein
VSDGRSKLSSAESKLDQLRHDAGRDIQAKIDAADRKVEEAAASAKKTTSSWFGGK